MAERKVPQNRYVSFGGGQVVGSHHGVVAMAKPKVLIVRQILSLSYSVLSDAFGMVGKPQLDGFRAAMVEDLQQHTGPVYSWRECAARVQGASMEELL